MVCKIIFCPEFPDILDKAGKKTRRRKRKRTQAIPKRYAFHANTKKSSSQKKKKKKKKLRLKFSDVFTI